MINKMNSEVQSIIRRLNNTNTGEPWFGRAVYKILDEVDAKKATVKPNGSSHSMLDLLYHMNTWTDFTLKRLQQDKESDMATSEKLDWRTIDPKIHTWKKGLSEFKSLNKKIIAALEKKDDDFLREMVDYRKYNFRFLMNGMIEHHIYHLGQIAYINKLLLNAF